MRVSFLVASDKNELTRRLFRDAIDLRLEDTKGEVVFRPPLLHLGADLGVSDLLKVFEDGIIDRSDQLGEPPFGGCFDVLEVGRFVADDALDHLFQPRSDFIDRPFFQFFRNVHSLLLVGLPRDMKSQYIYCQ